MTGRVLGWFAAVWWFIAPVSVMAAPASTEWAFNGNAASCTLESAGSASNASGAELDVQCEPGAQILGNVLNKTSAMSSRQRRMTLTAEVRVDAGMDASLWLKTSHDNATVLFENDAEQVLLGRVDEAGWSQRSISIPVGIDATQVSYGVLLQGHGHVAVRNLRVVISQPGAMSEAAQRVLERAIDIIKQHTTARDDLSWRVLETDARLFASGAQQTAEVYPAIQYLLTQLKDRRSLLLKPELASMLSHASQSSAAARDAATMLVFALPDGANLVLSTADLDARLARNWSAAPSVAQ